ncbi:MAG: hypothetical protein MUP98_08785 [Candidatus Aminicenantes bacterium]|nr:hypothetical protein [Candidatus Aminicenantes bacterium]
MKKRRALLLFAFFILVSVFSIVQAEIISGREAPSLQQRQGDRVETDAEVIVSAPTDIKQATAIYVFLGWIWLSIGILIFFLRLKIKEVDRLHDLGFFTQDKD